MKLKLKILVIVAGLFLGLAALDFAILRLFIYPSFEAHEAIMAEDDVSRVADAIRVEMVHLDRTCNDWASWDDTYAFVQTGAAAYIESNLQPGTFVDLQVDVLAFLDPAGGIVWGQRVDAATQQWSSRESLWQVVGHLEALLGQGGAGGPVNTIISTGQGFMMIAARPILRSDKTGPSRGWVVFGRLLSPSMLDRLVRQTRVSFTLVPPPPGNKADPVQTQEGTMTLTRPLVLAAADPVAWIIVRRAAVFIDSGRKVMMFAFISMVMGGLTLIAVLLGLLSQTVLRPLTALTRHATDISATTDLTRRLNWQRRDELGTLSRTIDTMVERLKEKTAAVLAANTALSKDLVERRAIEKSMALSQQMFQTISESARDVIIIIDHDGRILFWSRAGKSVLGYGETEVIGKDLHLLLAPERFHDAFKAGLKQFKATGGGPAIGRTLMLVALHKDGHELPVELSLSALEQDNRLQAVGVLRDISDRVQTDKERGMLAAAVDQSPELICITDPQLAVVYINPAFTATTGVSSAEAAGRPVMGLLGIEAGDPDDAGMAASVLAGNRWTGQIRLTANSGGPRILEAIVSPVIQHHHEASHWIFMMRDITGEVEKEKQFRQAQKMEAIGTLAGGIAHDFNNILSGIIGYTELAAQDPSLGDRGRQYLHKVLRAGQRAADLVKQILAFSRQGEQERKPLALSPIIKEALKLLRASLPATIQIVAHIGEDVAAVADATQIHQIIMNLCTNARQSIGEKTGRIDITLAQTVISEAVELRRQVLVPGHYARLTVQDSGPGIAEALHERIFDPFFTTKRKGEGTGLGLSVVHGIVAGMGGAITLDSQAGAGARFTIWLPAIDQPVPDDEASVSAPPRGAGHILVVDDEVFQTDMMTQMLESLGYTVSAVNRPGDALALFSRKAGAVDLIITDMTMPMMTGDLLALKCMEIRPEVPIVLCTGFSEYITAAKAERLGIRAFLMKPVVFRELAETVHRLIAPTGPLPAGPSPPAPLAAATG